METTSKPLKASRLVFHGKQQVSFEDFELSQLSAGQVRVRIELSLMSTGTENIVFNRNFDAGTHWDKWVKYPFYPGYAAIGIVEAVGSGECALKVGDRVACRCSHRSHAVEATEKFIPVPEGISPEEAVWFALAKITFHGALAASYALGDEVLIIGAGPIGQMSIRWACAAGASSVMVADLVEGRLEIARQAGATATIGVPIDEASDVILAANDGKLPRVVIDSTGNAAVFSAALGLTRRYGTVVLMGDTGQPAQQVLTSDVLMKGLRVIGAHDAHNTPEWNFATITRLLFQLVASGRINLKGLTSHRFNPQDCEAAYAIANRDRAATMGILFDWSDSQ